jgi:hypothetical protein
MNKGIELDYNEETGMATIAAPDKRIPLCYGNKQCRFFKLRWDDLGDGMGYHQYFCTYANRPVLELSDKEKKCPLMIWYVAPNVEGEKEQYVETIVVGPGNDKYIPPKGSDNSNGRSNRDRRSRKRRF